MVEENGTSSGSGVAEHLANAGSSTASAHVVAVTSIVQLTLPSQAPSAQVCTVLKAQNNISCYG